jgi:hypothetical protein
MMKGIIRAIALGALVQVAIGTGLTCWLFNHNNDMALQYAQMAERNANTYTDEQMLHQNNRVQVQFQDERNSLHEFIDARVDLKINQALKGIKQ